MQSICKCLIFNYLIFFSLSLSSQVIFPFATIADLYIDIYMHIADYNGQTVLVAPDGSNDLDDGYPESFIAPILHEKRTADIADFNYRNLCFTLTNFFGYPGRTLLENKVLKEKGLDQALQDYGQAGQMTRELLKSQNMYEYIAGTTTLGFLLDDGGHTNTDMTAISPIDDKSSFWSALGNVRKEKRDEFYKACPEYTPIMKAKEDRFDLNSKLKKLRTEIDRNLDGKFDEKDAKVKYNLNFALLTSSVSFSCGNMLPAMLKDYGIPLLGKQSGGGSCCVLYNPSTDGFGYCYSTHRGRLINHKGENIDAGIKPDYELEIADFFNIQKVTQLIESYYK